MKMKTVYYLLLGLCLAMAACKPDEPEMPESPASNNGVTFTYDSITATLTIFGTGDMEDYDDIDAPWKPYREEIQTVIIKDGVTSIGNRAFYNYPILAQVNIGNTVTSIGNYAFGYCSALTQVTIPDGVTSIGSSAFYKTALYDNAANWTNNVLYIDNCLIDATRELSGNYEIAAGTRVIADWAFTNLELREITIPNTVTHIGELAFCGCEALTRVTLPNSITSIENGTFLGCDVLTQINIPDGVTNIGDEAFRYCFALTEIIIPNSVTNIGEYAFHNCMDLEQVTIGNGVTSIGDKAFAACWALTAIHVDAANTAYCSEDGILFNKDKTTLICYPASKTGTAYAIPSSVTSIGSSAFNGCDFKQVEIPNSVTSIGDLAFDECSKLTQVNIPGSVTSIGNYAFYYCYALTQVTIGNGVTSIGNSAFSGCRALTQVTIGNSVTSIGSQAFSWCDALTAVYYTGDVAGWCGITFGNSSDSNPLFYAHNLYIGNTLVTELVIPEGISEIKDYAFAGCSATQVTIGNGVTSIGNLAFGYCSRLTEMTVLGTTPSKIENNTFDGIRRSIPVYVPAEALDAYRATVIWNGFNLQAITY